MNGSEITWVQLQTEQLDVVGLVLGSLGLAGALAAAALSLGALLGLWIIVRRRGHTPLTWIADGTLRLNLTPRA